MLVAALTCLTFIVPPSTSSPLPVPPSTHQKNTQMDLLRLGEYDPSSANEQKLNAPPFQCKAPPCTPSRILHRAKRTIDLFPFSLLKVANGTFIYPYILKQFFSSCARCIFLLNHKHIQVSLLGARLQIFPDAPFGANNYALFE